MFETQRPSSPDAPSATRSLVRTDLLGATLRELDHARSLDTRAKDHPEKNNDASPRTVHLRAHLDAQRHLVARRAAHVALAPVTTDGELQELRAAVRKLVGISGALARHLGAVGRMS